MHQNRSIMDRPFDPFYHPLTTFKFGTFPDCCATINLKSVLKQMQNDCWAKANTIKFVIQSKNFTTQGHSSNRIQDGCIAQSLSICVKKNRWTSC